jgi:formamidase
VRSERCDALEGTGRTGGTLNDVSEGWHNRWHPNLEPVRTIASGETVTVTTREGTDGVIGPASTHADLSRLDLGRAHQLSGPFAIDGAEPGDLLEVEFCDFAAAPFGFTAIFPGFGVLADLFEEPYLVKWSIVDGFARSDELPGVAIPDGTFCGVVGVAPSPELFREQQRREEELRAAGGPVAPNQPEGAVPRGAAQGLRTIPPRENGGNLDIPQLRAGSRLTLPVHVRGALVSLGDVHFAQGEGEVCGTGIETSAEVTLRPTVLKGPHRQRRFPSFETAPEVSRRYFATTGMGIGPGGVNGAMDVGLAAREALLEMLDHVCSTRGLRRDAAYALMSVAVDLRISELVNMPNPLVSALLPLDVFEGPAR